MSTTVLIDLAHLTGTATNGASTGMVEVRYSKRIEPADPASQIVVVRSFAVMLDATGKASVVVPPSEVDGFYTWMERVEGGITRYTSVPDVPTVNYRALVDVDPATYDPTVDATAAWWAMAGNTVTSGAVVGNDLILTRYDASTVNAGNVRGPQGDRGPKGDQGVKGDTGPAGGVTSVDGATGAVSLSSTYVAQADLTVTTGASISGNNTGDEAAASETVAGVVELATTTEATTGTDTTRATTPAGVKAALDAKAASDMSTYVAPTGTDDRLQVAGVDVEPEQVGAATAEQGVKADLVHAATPILTNLVRNGDFSAGATGWYVSSQGVISVVDGEARFVPSSLGNFFEQASPAAVSVGDKIYGAVTCRAGSACTYRWRIDGTTVARDIAVTTAPQTITLVTTATSTTANFRLVSYTGSTGVTAFFDNIIGINLTTIFGAGNEPSKEHMDVIMDSLGGWFDGSKAVPTFPLVKYLSDFNWIGNGSPYGVLTPHSKGIEYRDLDQTNGARKWISTGTTATSWVVTDGDTGWRTTYNYTQDEATWSTGTIEIRRINESVSVRFLITCTAGTGAAVAVGVVPASGFQVPITTTRTYAGLLALNTSVTLLRVHITNGNVYYYGPHTNTGSTFARSAQVLRGALGWMTDDPWPTTLPGSPA